MHRLLPLAALVSPLLVAACGSDAMAHPSAAERAEIARAIRATVADAYDFTKPDVERRLMSLYPDTGRIVSASGGRIITSRDSIAGVLRYFWESTGRNMRDPTLEFGNVYVDVLSPTSAVATWTYRIPHRTPTGEPHVVGGAWTALFVERDGRWVIVQEHLSDDPAP